MLGEELGWLIAKKTTNAGTSPQTHETGDTQSVPVEVRESATRIPLPNFATPQELNETQHKF